MLGRWLSQRYVDSLIAGIDPASLFPPSWQLDKGRGGKRVGELLGPGAYPLMPCPRPVALGR